MRDVHKIAIIGLIYAVVLSLVTLIFFNEYLLWTVLGSAVSLFNHSQMIRVTQGKYTAQKLVIHLMSRYILYIIILAVVWFDTKALGTNAMIYSYIFLLLGIFSVKVGVFIYATPLIKKPVEEVIEHHDE